MSGPAFRFLHTSDWLLHQVCYGLTEIPEPLRDLLMDAPYVAATLVCDLAIAEQVNFVLLSGDILNPLEAGPRGVSFLLQQLERFEQHGIAVYWAGGRSDPPERWPAGAVLPNNVSVFPKGRAEEIAHFIGTEHVATVVGRSWSGKGRIDATEFVSEHPRASDFRIGVVHGEADGDTLTAFPVNYWALGGERRRRPLYEHSQHAAVYSGTPQGRCPQDIEAAGCTLVQVDPDRQIQLQHISTDALRWRHERIPLTDNCTRKDIDRRLRERAQQLTGESGDRPLIVTWRLEATGKLAAALRHGGGADEIRKTLNQTLGMAAPCLWTAAVEVPEVEQLPVHWYDEDTILGDFLRAVRTFESEDQPLKLQDFVGRRDLDHALHDLLQISDMDERQSVLREVALLGAELLRGDA